VGEQVDKRRCGRWASERASERTGKRVCVRASRQKEASSMCSVCGRMGGECAGERVSRLERDEWHNVRECGHAGGRDVASKKETM